MWYKESLSRNQKLNPSGGSLHVFQFMLCCGKKTFVTAYWVSKGNVNKVFYKSSYELQADFLDEEIVRLDYFFTCDNVSWLSNASHVLMEKCNGMF